MLPNRFTAYSTEYRHAFDLNSVKAPNLKMYRSGVIADGNVLVTILMREVYELNNVVSNQAHHR